MNRRFFMMMMAAALMAAPAMAQEEGGVSGTVTKIWNNTKKKVRNSTQHVKEQFNINDAAADLVEVDGHKYMRLYRKDAFKGEGGDDFRAQCRAAFMVKYPGVEIMSCAIPQTDWEESTIRTATGKVSKYAKKIYCYILAKDGDDGYINARFSFRQLKKVGKTWQRDKSNWPNWERTDVMTPDVYAKVKE